MEIKQDYQVSVMRFSGWDWTISIGVMAVGVAGGVIGLVSDDTGMQLAGALAFPLLVGTAGGYLLAGLSFGNLDIGVSPSTITIGAQHSDRMPVRMVVPIPTDRDKISLYLPQAPATASKATRAPAAGEHSPVVAVFELHDTSGRLRPEERSRLTDFLATSLIELGKARVIPREQIRARLVEEKQGGYRACYEEGCQIELGRALAAEKSLSITLIRVGQKCTLTGKLFDLKTETAERAATAQADCTVTGLLEAMKQLAEKL